MASYYGISLYVEIAFDDTPLTAVASCTWTDVTSYVRGVQVNRGRQNELSGYQTGTASVRLDNRNRTFDPTYASATYAGKLLPMKRIRIRATAGLVSATIFTGYIQGWPVTYPGMVDNIVTLNCVDAFRVLEQSAQPASAYHRQVVADSPTYYWPLQTTNTAVDGLVDEIAGAELARYRGSDVLDPVTSFTLPLGESVAQETGYAKYVNSNLTTLPGTVEFWFHNDTSAVGSGSVIKYHCGNAKVGDFNYGTFVYMLVLGQTLYASYSDKTASKSNVSDFSYGAGYANCGPLTTGSHHVVVVPSTTKVDVYVDGQLRRSIATQAGAQMSDDSSKYIDTYMAGSYAVSHLATYASALTGTQIADHYSAGVFAFGHPYGERGGARIGRVLDAIGWPAGDRALSTGETALDDWLPGGDTALSECRGVESAEQGMFFIDGAGKVTFRDRQWQMTNSRATTAQATLGDSGTETLYRDITIDGNHVEYVRNVVTVSYAGSRTITVSDSTSTTAYGKQADSVDGSQIAAKDAPTARNLASYRLRLRKTPAARVPEVAVDLREPIHGLATNAAALIGLELGDRVTVKRRTAGYVDTWTQAETVQGIAHNISNNTWEMSFYLAPAPPSYTEGPYLTLGDATYGKIGAAAGNLIPY